jgi:hypothetical protein
MSAMGRIATINHRSLTDQELPIRPFDQIVGKLPFAYRCCRRHEIKPEKRGLSREDGPTSSNPNVTAAAGAGCGVRSRLSERCRLPGRFPTATSARPPRRLMHRHWGDGVAHARELLEQALAHFAQEWRFLRGRRMGAMGISCDHGCLDGRVREFR